MSIPIPPIASQLLGDILLGALVNNGKDVPMSNSNQQNRPEDILGSIFRQGESLFKGAAEKGGSFVKDAKEDVTDLYKRTVNPLEVTREGNTITATVDIPGVLKEDVNVRFTELDGETTRISISATRRFAQREKTSFKDYSETFTGLVDKAGVSAKVEHGVLTVTVPLKVDPNAEFTVPVS